MAGRTLRPLVNKLLSHVSVRVTDLRNPVGAMQREGINILTPVVRDLRAMSGRPVKLVQIGANDGEQEDPVMQLIASGLVEAVLVEPLPQLAAILRSRYETNPSVHIQQCAVGTVSGEMPFYYLEDNLGTDLTVYSSLDRVRMEKQVRRMNDSAQSRASNQSVTLHAAPVAVRTLGEIIADRGWGALDVLVIDAEGLDGELVMSALRSGLTVDCVFFEYCNMLPPEFAAVTAELKYRGYRLAQSGKDMLAVHHAADDRRASVGGWADGAAG